jgi:phosphatidylserine/phosphatidylglycerophosphate/cardiolipin synthase-like enzyme/outer membrane protein OmpA-like peptidoglycan-associated protein
MFRSDSAEWSGPLAGWSGETAPDANVRWLQSALNQVTNAGLAVDGIAGNATRRAVRAFQETHGLTVDGIAGPQTMAALRAAMAGGSGTTVAAAPPACTGLPLRQTLDRFAFGQSHLEPHHQPRIDAIAACLVASLDTPTPISGLELIGHTDPVGSDQDNLALGQRRAQAVGDAIIAAVGRMAPNREYVFVMVPRSRGETEQLPGDPAANRRVEIVAPFAFPLPPGPNHDRPPPFRSPLDPPRWGPILARAMSPRAVLRAGNAVRHLVDAENPGTPVLSGYGAMVAALRAAQGGNAFIYLLGWVCYDDFDMITCDPTSKLHTLLADAASRGVQVRAVFWDHTRTSPAGRRATLASVDHIGAMPGGAAILDDHGPLGTSHHQKMLVVHTGETLVGFTGGLDINPDRILPSTVSCSVPPPPPTQQPQPIEAGDDESSSGGGGEPLHDVHCRIEGPAAFDLVQTFINRWDVLADSRSIERRAPLRGRALTTPPAPVAQPSVPAQSLTGQACSVAIGRTVNPPRGSGLPRERDIKNLLLAAIANARRFIYMEDQYLINLDAARALRTALPNIAHLTIVIPASDISDLPCKWAYRREFITTLTRGLSPDLAQKVRIFELVDPPIPPIAPPCSTRRRVFRPTFGRHTYVHAKCWVFDDELAVIGSANCNLRGWESDTEIDAFIFDDRIPTAATVRTFAQQMRMDLWSEHLALPPARLADGAASAAFWLRPPSGAHILPYCADFDTEFSETACSLAKDQVDPPSP